MIQPGFEPGTVVTLLALRCSALDRCATREPKKPLPYRELIANGQELKKFIHGLDVLLDVVCIQETWFNPQLDYIVPGFISVRGDGIEGPGGGCATFIK